MRKLRKRTFAEILKELDPNGEVHEASGEQAVLPMSFPTRKEEAAQKQAKKFNGMPNSQNPKRPSKTSSNKFPPGFKKPETQLENFDEITNSVLEGIQSLMNDFNIPPALQQFIVTYAAPYIDRFIKKITDTLERKINEIFKS